MVHAGDALLTFDADFVARRARSLLTEVRRHRIPSASRRSSRQAGRVTAGRDVIMRLTLAERFVPACRHCVAQGEAVRSRPIVIAAEGGLHARPAAAITAAARHFTVGVRLVSGAREANARSVVSIMALEVGQGDDGDHCRPRQRRSGRRDHATGLLASDLAERSAGDAPRAAPRPLGPTSAPQASPRATSFAACPRLPASPLGTSSSSATMTR